MTRAAALLVAVGAVAGCADLDTGPETPFSLEFVEPASPSIVSGDSLRDIEGIATPLRAIVYNLDGEVITGAPVTFVVVDTSGSLVLDQATGHVTAVGAARGTARVFATIGSLQAPDSLVIVPPPDSAAQHAPLDTLRYSFADPGRNTSGAIAVRVMRDSANAPVPSYLVRFRLADLADTVVAKLVDDRGLISTLDPSGGTAIDTTALDGVASRRVRLTPSVSLAIPLDSIGVLADVRLRGEHVSGSPVLVYLYVTPFVTP